GPVRCSRAARAPLLRCPRTPRRPRPSRGRLLAPPGARALLARCARSAAPMPPDPAPPAAKPRPASCVGGGCTSEKLYLARRLRHRRPELRVVTVEDAGARLLELAQAMERGGHRRRVVDGRWGEWRRRGAAGGAG